MTPEPKPAAPCGVVNLYKPAGPSSAQYVYRLRPVFGIRKVGHAGTLDPLADGVLLACVGRATKLVERLMNLPKRYRTTIRLDVTTETLDTETPFLPVPGASEVSPQRIAAAVSRLIGRIEQAPPAFSAVKIKGRSSHEYARRGLPVEPKPRPVTIYAVDILSYRWPRLELDISCGRGTYIRAIARDLGRALECGGCCESLTRTAVGPFVSDQGIDLSTASPDEVRAALLPINAVLQRLDNTPAPPDLDST